MNGEKDTDPLDLNNLPNEFGARRDHDKQTQFDTGSSSSGQSGRKKKKDERGKLYECRFCSLKFCKSQALGGHMNRHRQERETETLNKARMLVFSNESNMPTVRGHPAHHLGGQIVGPNGGFHQQVITDPAVLHFRPAYPVQSVSIRQLPAITQSSIGVLQHQQNPPDQPYLYSSPPRPQFMSSHPSYYKPSNNYCAGNVLGTTIPHTANYNCNGAPAVGRPSKINSTINGVRESGTSSTTNGAALYVGHQDDALSWGMRGLEGTSTYGQLQPATRPGPLSSVSRLHDGW